MPNFRRPNKVAILKQVIEDALREFFSRQSLAHDPVKLETFAGAGLKPGG